MTMLDDDRCQHPDECLKSCFTYCPHCHLFLCITHLNQHHTSMKNEIPQMMNEADNQRILLEQKINKIKQQQMRLNQFYEREIEHLNDMHKFVINISENKLNNNSFYSSMFEYKNNVKQFDIIKQEQEKKSLITQIDRILQQENQAMDSKSKDEKSSMIDNDTTIDKCSEPEVEDSLMDFSMDKSSIDIHHQTDSDNFSLKSKWLINLTNPKCPLSHANAFGLSTNHDIPGMPCHFFKHSNSLTYGQCYYHLLAYHRLKPSLGKLIMKILSSNEHKTIDLTTLDIFSKWSSPDILSRSKSLLIAHCPLTQGNIYGLQTQHKVTLCTPRSPVHLYQHLRTFHCFKSNYALRLISAIINNEPITNDIFKPNENIINNSIRSKNRTKN